MYPSRTEAERRRGAVHRQHVAVVLAIASHDEGLDLHFVVEAGGEQRANRPVHEPRGQRFLHRRTALALEKAAGEFAGSGGAFAIVAGEREEVDAGAGCSGRGGDHHHGVAIADHATARGLFG
jgi:hypothetical protein